MSVITSAIDKIREDRKFFFAIFAFLVFTLLLLFGFVKESGYTYLASTAFFGYCGANVVQKVGLAYADNASETQKTEEK